MTLEALIQQARDEGKWLFCAYQQLWFSPNELEAENATGRFRWGAQNFVLRDPMEKVNLINHLIEDLRKERDSILERITR